MRDTSRLYYGDRVEPGDDPVKTRGVSVTVAGTNKNAEQPLRSDTEQSERGYSED